MKKFFVFSLLLLFVLLMVGCGKEGDQQSPPSLNPSQGDEQGTTAFVELNDEEIPDPLKSRLDELKQQRGYAVYNEGNSHYVFVSAGEKPTGGYSIRVKEIQKENGMANVILEETSPAEGDIVTTVITYPYQVIKFDGEILAIVAKTENEIFNVIQ